MSIEGRIVAVCIGPGGIPKHPVEEADVSESGLDGDAHRFHLHGGANRAVCLFSAEDAASLLADGVPCEAPGSFGENLHTEGLDYRALAAGDRLAVGEEVVLEIFDIREPCGTLKKLDRRFPDLMVGRSGFVCRVVRPGTIRPGEAITRIATP